VLTTVEIDDGTCLHLLLAEVKSRLSCSSLVDLDLDLDPGDLAAELFLLGNYHIILHSGSVATSRGFDGVPLLSGW